MVCEFLALSSSVRYFGFSCALRAAGGVYMVGVLERGVVEGRIRSGVMWGEMEGISMKKRVSYREGHE